MARAKKNVVQVPSYTSTSDTEMLGKTTKELKVLAAGRPSGVQKRAAAEVARRTANKPYKAWKRAQKAAA